jgi:hypothetical protein
METKDIKDLMLSTSVEFIYNTANLLCVDKKENYLRVNSIPENNYWDIRICDEKNKEITLTDEQYNMICKHVENEYYEHHSNNTAFTDDDIEHFNSLIN